MFVRKGVRGVPCGRWWKIGLNKIVEFVLEKIGSSKGSVIYIDQWAWTFIYLLQYEIWSDIVFEKEVTIHKFDFETSDL